MMQNRRPRWEFLLLCLMWLLCACALQWIGAHASESSKLPVLKVGEERRRESLAFFDGSSCEYEVQGLQTGKWYEIKISYPASIPASFDITFLQHRLQSRRRAGRRLLNIEKTMFYSDGIFPQQEPGPLGRVRVEVHPAGVISKHHASDHAFIIYNICVIADSILLISLLTFLPLGLPIIVEDQVSDAIMSNLDKYELVCEEVFLGIPKQAWWVGFLAVLVICSAIYISGRLPATLIPAKLRVA